MTRNERLIAELRARKPVCTCGAVAYPSCWMTKTREKAVDAGLIRQCPCANAGDMNVLLIVPPEQL